jgi:hypothetical protein
MSKLIQKVRLGYGAGGGGIKVILSFFKRILQKTSFYKIFLILSVLFNPTYED